MMSKNRKPEYSGYLHIAYNPVMAVKMKVFEVVRITTCKQIKKVVANSLDEAEAIAYDEDWKEDEEITDDEIHIRPLNE